ncbi:MAG: hypothetical protein SNH88_07090 [Rikenellaceae bacterium]
MKTKILAATFAAAALLLSAATTLEAKPKSGETQSSLNLKSSFVDTMNPNGLKKDGVKDYGLKSGTADQTKTLQRAIDEISAGGGGILTITDGTYYINGVNLKSNVHIVVSEGVTFRLTQATGAKAKPGGLFFNFSTTNENTKEYIENCSIRGVDGKHYTVDYTEFENDGTSVRFVIARMVKNFLVADALIKDNYTLHCGITFTPSTIEGANSWGISRPTNGEIRHCSIIDANSGYGLCQLHGAQDLYFEDLYSLGGVTLRLESGSGGGNAGVYDVKAHKVHSENARASLMMSPHVAQNGIVLVDGISSVSSGGTVIIHKGFIDRKNKDQLGKQPGTYAKGSKVINIHGVYGEKSQVHDKEIYICNPVGGALNRYKFNDFDNPKCYIGPSYAVVYDGTEGMYSVECSNISGEGFPSHNDKVLFESDIEDRAKRKKEILESLPDYRPRPEKTPKKK